MFDLVRVTTKDNLILSGLYVAGEKDKSAIIHIHGFEGDFFSNSFIPPLAEKLKKNGHAFLTVQTRGMASDYLFSTTDGTYKRYGSHFELHEEAYLDIDAWIEFLIKEGYNKIILQGHSLGTVKIMRYYSEGSYRNHIKKLILLAPFDNIALANKITNGKWPEYLEIAKKNMQIGKGEDIIPKEWKDAISYQTYVSWFEDNDYTKMFNFYDTSYSFPLLQKIEIPVKVIVGTKDEFFHTSNPNHPEEAIQIMQKHIKQFSYRLIEQCTHSYKGYENIVAEEVLNFID